MYQKKSLTVLILGAAAGVLGTQAVQAADVSLYGRVSTSIRMTKADGQNAAVDMNNEGSRWGIRLQENINSDLSAKVWLESGFNSDTGGLSNSGGVKNTLFDRHAVLSLASKTYGEFGFGRMGSVRSAVMPYSLVLLPLDPVNGAYYDIVSIGVMFGADPRANNTLTYVTPRWAGWKFGTSYSFATTDQEEPHTSENTRLVSLGGNFENNAFGFYFGGSYVMNGKSSADSTDRGKGIDREDGSAYTVGLTWKPTDKMKLYSALQWQSGWRSVAGWRVDAGKQSAADKYHGVDGLSAMVGINYWLTPALRATGSWYYFDGKHKLAGNAEEEGSRHTLNGILDYRLSKTLLLYGTLTYSKGEDVLDTSDINKWVGRVGMMKFF